MHQSEPRAHGNRRSIWISVFAVALGLSLVNAGAAFAGGEHPPPGTEGTPSSWSNTSDEGHAPPETSGPEQPCTEEKPPGHEKPPVETPPVTPPVETPPVVTPPVEAPLVETVPTETPQAPSTPLSPESPTAPVEETGSGRGEVLPQEQEVGGGGSGGVAGQQVTTTAEATLPFTGSRTPLLVLVGVGFLGLGAALRRVVAEQG
jgi:hypothetical protein